MNTLYCNSFISNVYRDNSSLNETLFPISLTRKFKKKKFQFRSNTCQGLEIDTKHSNARLNASRNLNITLNTISNTNSEKTQNNSNLNARKCSLRQFSKKSSLSEGGKTINPSTRNNTKKAYVFGERKINLHKTSWQHTITPSGTNELFKKNNKDSNKSDRINYKIEISYEKIGKCKMFEENMLNELNKLSSYQSTINNEALTKEREKLLGKFLGDISNLNPMFGTILTEIKELFDKNTNEIFVLKENNKKHQEIIDMQKTHIGELKNQIDSCTKENIKYKQNIEDNINRINMLTDQLKEMIEINESLKKINICLEKKLDEFVIIESEQREAIIESHNNKNANKTIIEIGKNKVKIPMLDFTKINKKNPSKISIIIPDNDPSHANSDNQYVNTEILLLSSEIECISFYINDSRK